MAIYNSAYQIQSAQSGQQQPYPRGLQVLGPVVPVQVEVPTALANQLQQSGQTVPTPITGIALVDTGASISGVDAAVVQQLGVQTVGMANVGGVGGVQQQAQYPARFVFPGTGLPNMEFNRLVGANLTSLTPPGSAGQQLIALLGRDILTRSVLVYNGLTGTFTLAF